MPGLQPGGWQTLTGKFAEGFAASLGVGTEFGGDVSGVVGHLNLKWEF